MAVAIFALKKVKLLDDLDVLDTLIQVIGESINQRDALSIVKSLYEDDVINKREGNLILAAIDKKTLAINDRDMEDQLRARILIGILNHLRYES